jgi:hypothetical protein
MDGDEERWQECFRVEKEIADEDVRTLERYRHQRLPLDLRIEVHAPADRLSLAYRRLLLDLVLHDPTASPPSTDPTDPPTPSVPTTPTSSASEPTLTTGASNG